MGSSGTVFMKNKIYYIVGIFLIVAIFVVAAIFLTSNKQGSVIDIATPVKGKAFHRVSSIILEPGMSQNLYYHRAGWFLKKVEFRLPEIANPDFSIKALVTVKGQKPRVEDWTSIGKKIFCLDRRTEQLKDVMITISNNSASSTLKDDVSVFAMRDGCNEWSGSIRYEWSDTKEKSNGQGVLNATFTLKENAYATEYVVSDGGYSFNSIGCEQGWETKTYTIISDGSMPENSLRLVPLEGSNYELKLPISWGKTTSAKEYLKKNRTCIYGRERGDTVKDLEPAPVYTLKEIMEEKFIVSSDSLTGNLKGGKEIIKTLEDGTVRKIKITWDLARQ
jgi:hypothetical protein